MKKIILHLVIVFSLVSVSFAQDGMDFNVHISGPVETVARMLKFGNGTRVSITNPSPFYTEAIFVEEKGFWKTVLEEKIFVIEPSSAIYDAWQFEFDNSVLPVFFRFYSDKSRKNLVGMGSARLPINKDRPTSYPININEVAFTNGSYQFISWVSPYPQPDMVPARRVDMPRIERKSANVFGAMNGTLFDVVVRMDGEDVRTLKTGEIFWSEVTEMSRSGSYTPQFVLSDRGRMGGHFDDRRIDTNPNGPDAILIVLKPQDIRR